MTSWKVMERREVRKEKNPLKDEAEEVGKKKDVMD